MRDHGIASNLGLENEHEIYAGGMNSMDKGWLPGRLAVHGHKFKAFNYLLKNYPLCAEVVHFGSRSQSRGGLL